MARSNEFLAVFNEIETYLKGIGRADASFNENLTAARYKRNSPVIPWYDELQRYRSLRNTIVHDYDGGTPIAEPNDYALQRLSHIRDQLIRPPLVEPFIRPVAITDVDQPLRHALQIMRKSNFSQLPVYDQAKHFYALLTGEAIARWLAGAADDDTAQLDTALGTILSRMDPTGPVQFCARNTRLLHIQQQFNATHHAEQRLAAMIITQDGKPQQKPIGIITGYDLAGIAQRLSGKPSAG